MQPELTSLARNFNLVVWLLVV
uniref:Uncharacterized protein n=1 Tax=Anguilla anguilla TaxID=7936 RepID=A0A0E9SF24_ANGAN